MWWLAVFAGIFFFRERIAQLLAPVLPSMAPLRAAFFMHLLLLIAAVLHIIPFELVGIGFIKRPSYLGAMWFSTLSCIFTLKGNYGSPPFPQNFSIRNIKQSFQSFTIQLQPWMQKAMLSVDFHFLFFSLIFLTAYPSLIVLAILGRRSLWSVCTVCTKDYPTNRLWAIFEPRWKTLQEKNAQVLEYSALAEVGLGLWLAVSIAMPSRQILACILYWHYLRMRYQVPRSKATHEKAWGQIAEKTSFLFKIPFACKLRDMAVGWFTRSQ